MQTRTTTRRETPMTTRTRDTRTALDAYMEHHAAALALVERIRDAIANHDDAPVEDPDTDITWGHVGDIAETRRTLQEVSDRLFNEGSTPGRLPPLPRHVRSGESSAATTPPPLTRRRRVDRRDPP